MTDQTKKPIIFKARSMGISTYYKTLLLMDELIQKQYFKKSALFDTLKIKDIITPKLLTETLKTAPNYNQKETKNESKKP